ncbi:hypothetical protein [Pelagibacterium lentulum]|uniref:Uncharacterized protein n=1 Tax=Pelagibacterium lentulum TaxID=2029865 RepID=A0A916VZV8_9HYPH|nr:hypothetical protein [Pelagibacterium lentulum]GGA54904.1 hypothetical protein GCM10011499_26330 [Pelagibacterium lentulum]
MKRPVITVFADSGATPFDGVYAYAGDAIGKKAGHIICPLREGLWPKALVNAALKHAKTQITFVTTPETVLVDIPAGIDIETAQDHRAANMRAASLGQTIVGLPANFGTISALYTAWADLGGAQSGKTVGLLNRKNAFEVVRGFFTDVAAVGIGNIDHLIQISDNFDDLLNRLMRLEN